MNTDDEKIVKCHCGEFEIEGKMTWLQGRAHCRDCYKQEYAEVYGEPYKWDDKDWTAEDVAAVDNYKRKEGIFIEKN